MITAEEARQLRVEARQLRADYFESESWRSIMNNQYKRIRDAASKGMTRVLISFDYPEVEAKLVVGSEELRGHGFNITVLSQSVICVSW